MLLESVRGLKANLMATQAAPFLEGGPAVIRSLSLDASRMRSSPTILPSMAIGVAPRKQNQYFLAVRCQRPELMKSPEVEEMKKRRKAKLRSGSSDDFGDSRRFHGTGSGVGPSASVILAAMSRSRRERWAVS